MPHLPGHLPARSGPRTPSPPRRQEAERRATSRPEDTHHAARHVLVAAAQHQHAVHPLALNRHLHAIGDHLARNQRILHAFRTHRHAVGDGGRAEHLRVGSSGLDGDGGGIGQWLRTGVAGRDGGMAVGDPDHRLVEIALLVTQRVVHGPVRGASNPLRDMS